MIPRENLLRQTWNCLHLLPWSKRVLSHKKTLGYESINKRAKEMRPQSIEAAEKFSGRWSEMGRFASLLLAAAVVVVIMFMATTHFISATSYHPPPINPHKPMLDDKQTFASLRRGGQLRPPAPATHVPYNVRRRVTPPPPRRRWYLSISHSFDVLIRSRHAWCCWCLLEIYGVWVVLVPCWHANTAQLLCKRNAALMINAAFGL